MLSFNHGRTGTAQFIVMYGIEEPSPQSGEILQKFIHFLWGDEEGYDLEHKGEYSRWLFFYGAGSTKRYRNALKKLEELEVPKVKTEVKECA